MSGIWRMGADELYGRPLAPSNTNPLLYFGTKIRSLKPCPRHAADRVAVFRRFQYHTCNIGRTGQLHATAFWPPREKEGKKLRHGFVHKPAKSSAMPNQSWLRQSRLR